MTCLIVITLESKGGSVSSVLLKANVTIQDNTVCASQYGNFVGANMLCASAPGKDTCQVNYQFFQENLRFPSFVLSVNFHSELLS
jgi:hypothetical protein